MGHSRKVDRAEAQRPRTTDRNEGQIMRYYGANGQRLRIFTQ